MKRRHRSIHAQVWKLLAVILPIALIAALVLRQDGPSEAPAIKISEDANAEAKRP